MKATDKEIEKRVYLYLKDAKLRTAQFKSKKVLELRESSEDD